MTSDPLDLWPAFEVEPLTPVAILKHQAERLKERTHGLLYAEVVTTERYAPDDSSSQSGREVVHRFEIVAPGWNNYRHQLFRCHHDREFVYPAFVTLGDPDDLAITDWKKASSQEEFTQAIRDLLGSKETLAVIQSLLARVTEARNGNAAKTA